MNKTLYEKGRLDMAGRGTGGRPRIARGMTGQQIRDSAIEFLRVRTSAARYAEIVHHVQSQSLDTPAASIRRNINILLEKSHDIVKKSDGSYNII